MKKLLCVINFMLLLTFGIQASELPLKQQKTEHGIQSMLIDQSSTPCEPMEIETRNIQASDQKKLTFESLPRNVIREEIMSQLKDKDLLNLVKCSRRMKESVQCELEKRRMLKQRADFVKRLSSDGTKLDLCNLNLSALHKGVFDAPEFKDIELIDLRYNQLTELDKNIFSKLKNTLVVLGTPSPEKEIIFRDIPDFVIQQEIMPKLENEDLLAFAKTSKTMHELSKPEFEKRYLTRMLKQRDEFKKMLSQDYDLNSKCEIIYNDGTRLELQGRGLKIIYKGVFDDAAFKDLHKLNLSHNQLKELSRETFKGLKNLQELNLSNNNFKELSPNIFIELNNLQELHLYYNQLQELQPKIFNGLKYLRFLNLHTNELKNLSPEIFKDLKNLSQLNLQCNQLTYLDKDIFKELKNLEALYIQNNELTTLDKDIFNELNNLQLLWLHKNQLTYLDKDVFKELKNLENLDLSFNQLKTLDKEIFNELINLQDLTLANNQLTALNKYMFNKLKNLKYLSLYRNKLTSNNIEEFEELRNVLPNTRISLH